MDPNGIDVKLGRFTLNEANVYSMQSRDLSILDEPDELGRYLKKLYFGKNMLLCMEITLVFMGF